MERGEQLTITIQTYLMLNLAEELFLLALHDEDGHIVNAASTALPYGVAGALVLELALRERVRLDEDELAVLDAAPTGAPALDHALQQIEASDEPRNTKHWVQVLGGDFSTIKDLLLAELVERGILKEEERRFLWIVPYTRHPEAQGGAEDRVRRALHDVVLGEHVPDEHMAALISLVHACDLTAEVFGEDEEAARRRIDEIVEGEHVGRTVSAVVEEAQAAVMAAGMASTTASMAASSAACSTAATC